jgi:uncharacterized membrane protein
VNLLRELFSHICGQGHSWVLGDQTLPFCQRCTGLYVGALLGLVLLLVFRPRPRAAIYWIHGVFLLLMIPFGFHLIEHGSLLRTITGTLFGFGLVYYLALNPITAWRWWKPGEPRAVALYLLLMVMALVLLLVAVTSGGSIAAFVVSGLGALGLASLCALVVMNLAVLPDTVRTLRSAAHSG